MTTEAPAFGKLASRAEAMLRAGEHRTAGALSAQILALHPGDDRATLIAACAAARHHGPVDRYEDSPVPRRIAVGYRLDVQPEVRLEEAREIVLGIVARGRSCGRLPRRFGGGTLPNGVRGFVHVARPDLCVLVRRGRVVALRISRRGA